MFAHCFIDNVATGRIHLAFFSPAPFPGALPSPMRWRSRGHHTVGAATQEEADQHLAELRAKLEVETTVDLGRTSWDGNGVPALNLIGPDPSLKEARP